jgi:hypothetical protein
VRRLLDGDLNAEDLRPALHRIADDEQAREILQFEVASLPSLTSERNRAPSGFADRTMDALAASDAERSPDPAAEDAPGLLRRWWNALTTPVALRVRPVTASAVGLALVLGVLMFWMGGPAPSGEPAPPTATQPDVAKRSAPSGTVQQAAASSGDETVWTRFVYTSQEADSVAVAGDFSNWEPVPLSPRRVNGQTVWTGLVPVPRGEHEYQFVIDGTKWVTDPLAPVQREDGFGARNAVLKL